MLLVLLFINYTIAGFDFFNPAVVFTFINIISVLVCTIATSVYDIPIHTNTLIVLVVGVLVFTIVNFFTEYVRRKRGDTRLSDANANNMTLINIRWFWVVAIVFLEVFVAYSMIRYVLTVPRVYYGSHFDLATSIGLYNDINKNHGDELRKMSISAGMLYSYGWPLCRLGSVILAAIGINNYCLTKKINIILIPAVALPVFMSLLTGSRSNAFRLFTAFIAEYILINRYCNGSYRKGSAKLLIKIIAITFLAIIGLSLVINIIGRTVSIDTYQYFVAYIGGPIINLDLYLQKPYHSSFFGQETFEQFYAYIGSVFGIESLRYDLYLPYNTWDGIYLGNVYTMYYMFIEDFGYWGILPLTTIIALFYMLVYSDLMNMDSIKGIFRPKLFIYSYLFNDLIMLTFSNRFFETSLNTLTIRMYYWLIVIWILYKKGIFGIRFTFNGLQYRVRLRRSKG